MSPLTVSSTALIAARMRRLKTRLVRNAVLALIFIGGGGFVAVSGMFFADHQEEQKKKYNSEISGNHSRVEQIHREAAESESSIRLYGLLLETKMPMDFSLDRDMLRQRLTELSDKHYLVKVGLSAGADQEVTGAGSYKSGTEIVRPVELEISAIDDTHVAAFLNDLYTAIPGYVEYTSFELKRTAELNPDMLQIIALGKRPPLVGATLRFQWHGIRPTPKPADAAAGAAPGAVTPAGMPPGAAPGMLPGANNNPGAH